MAESDTRHSRPRRWRRRLVRFAGGFAAAVLAAELVLRFGYGFGDPPLLDRDPQIEYLYKPSRRYHPLHHTVSINSHSMRSPEFPAKKKDPRELRVLVIGDSIVTGGARIDQHELATEHLRESLAKSLGRPVVVGNIACGSWGPPNQLAYLKRFGLFDADVVLIVLNSGDADDVPGLEPLGSAWPQRTPWLAIEEPLLRLTERHAPGLARSLGFVQEGSAPPYEQRVAIAVQALRDMTDLLSGGGAKVGVVQWWKLSELRNGAEPGHDLLLRELEKAGVPVWQSGGGGGGDARFDANPDLFFPGDDAHPNAAGQARLAELLQECVTELLAAPDAPPPPAPGASENPGG